jgi:hypothetical protein
MTLNGESPSINRHLTNAQVTILVTVLIIAVAAIVVTTILANHTQKIAVILPTTQPASPITDGLRSCQADGATIAKAMTAFEVMNPGVQPTEAALLSNAKGGPYLQSWANSPAYTFTLSGGVLRVQSTSASMVKIIFENPSSCVKANVR